MGDFFCKNKKCEGVRLSACCEKKLKSSVKTKERNGTNNVKGLANDLHTIFSASKLQDHSGDKGTWQRA